MDKVESQILGLIVGYGVAHYFGLIGLMLVIAGVFFYHYFNDQEN